MAKEKKPGRKNRVVHRPQIGTFLEQSEAQVPESQEDYGYEVELQEQGGDAQEKSQAPVPKPMTAKPQVQKEIVYTSPKVLLKPVIIIVAGVAVMLAIKLLINLVSG